MGVLPAELKNIMDMNIAEMRNDEGVSLSYELHKKSSYYAIRISEDLGDKAAYRRLKGALNTPRLLVYFQFVIRREIYPFIRQGCIIQWYKKNNRLGTGEKIAVEVKDRGVFELLKPHWKFEGSRLEFVGYSSGDRSRAFVSRAKRCIKKIIKNASWALKKKDLSLGKFPRGILACHYGEGFDFSRRNDLNWYPDSGIEPGRILVYIDTICTRTNQPVEREEIKKVEEMRINWVALKEEVLKDRGLGYWQPSSLKIPQLFDMKSESDPIERWIADMGKDLMEQVDYWRRFYADFNVKINYITDEGRAENIAQVIAFDTDGAAGGVLLGKERSEIYYPLAYSVGFHPKHVFFVWNKRPEYYVGENHDRIDYLVVTGYPNDLFRKKESFSEILRQRGAVFIVTLFDTGFFSDSHASPEDVAGFYRKFLEWLISDTEIGLVIKSKKSNFIERLPSMHPLLQRALDTGRCIRIEDVFGRLPSDASFGADMAVGIGISSAVTEAVITGCRGIDYDPRYFKEHEFYDWGYERLIFDNLEKLMAAMKRYKANRESEPRLGDWSDHIDELDPFRDGKGGQRMGEYMRYLLEAFDKGSNKDEAIRYANGRYANQWGIDKIIKCEARNA